MGVPPELTKREREIVPFLVSGATRFEIANHFGLSDETIKVHTRNILTKFGATSLRDVFSDILNIRHIMATVGLGFRDISWTMIVFMSFRKMAAI
jgi:DNA-binding NarL/FixJ family response regulator